MKTSSKKSPSKKTTAKKSTTKKSATKKAAPKSEKTESTYSRVTYDLRERLSGPDLRKIAEGILVKAQEISRNLQSEIKRTTKKSVNEVLLIVGPKKSKTTKKTSKKTTGKK